ncbi:MAG: hypothetical protein JSV38_08365 [Desulfobacterales bacterium]|nr:MAG: hypothetical protein JSV38_08365 [Desulfobacterales bacterium]
MGLLDELKNQAEEEKATEEEMASRQAEGEQFYEEELQPRLLKTFEFFNQLTQHLAALKTETIVDYPLLPGGGTVALRQGGYKVLIDSSKAPKKIDFMLECTFDKPVEFEIESGMAVQGQIDLYERYGMCYQREEKKGPGGQIVSAKFVLDGSLPLKATIEADVDAGDIKLTIRNFSQPGYIKYPLKVDQFNDAFLDQLGGFIIRKEASLFGSQELSEEAKQKLRQKIIEEQKMREHELEEAERLRNEEEAAEKVNADSQSPAAKVALGKDSLKGMFSRLKKQAGFGDADEASQQEDTPPGSTPQV